MDKIFVGGIPGDFRSQDLKDYFDKFGRIIEATVMYDFEGRSRRFGFVTFGKLFFNFF